MFVWVERPCNTPRRSVHRSDDNDITGSKYVGLTLDTLLAEERLRVPRRASPPPKAQAHGPYT
ncbi:BQ5605_C006g03791 [Microbotryum silenes-dioicae]|uniref:BQ5605_C006g03791 protein n=1 Tax=Microbotryum silenes-dioicae TaxID=796604 RepID=A0A2X0P7E4_9BASI|nr:BQ5605_C006g03791 [Microbotryum silenes-dioicae]